MTHTCRIELDGESYDFPVVEGTEHELAIDIGKLRERTGYITLDDGYGNTGSCSSEITYIDGDAGILRYRGIPIEDLAERSSFVETAWLVIFGHLPTVEDRNRFADLLTENSMMHQSMRKHFEGFPPNAHPMAILSAMINALSVHETHFMDIDDEATMEQAAARLMSKVRTIAAAAYKSSVGEPLNYPRYDYKYCENFLHMMFSVPHRKYEPTPEVAPRHSTSSSCCTPTTSKTARPARFGWWPPARPICSPAAQPASARCGVRCTAVPTSP